MWKEREFPFREAYLQSLSGERRGDRPEEVEYLRRYLKGSKWGVITDNPLKFSLFKNTLSLFGIDNVVQLNVPTDAFDLLQMPALGKALAGRNISDCDLILSRGRLGLPGSGALTVLVNSCGDVVSAVTSPPHVVHRLSLETAVFLDTFRLLRRIGLKPLHSGITEKTATVYSDYTLFDVARRISERKAEPLKGFRGERLLIVGGYLNGFFMGDFLKGNFREVYIYDVEAAVMELSPFPPPSRDALFDLILDLTGFGGAPAVSGNVAGFKGKVVVSEEPSGRGRFETEKQPDFVLRLKKGKGKTSGTMTLTVNIVRELSREVEELSGVLYAVPNLLFAESLLFGLKSGRAFLDVMEFPALTVSVRKESVASVELKLKELLDRKVQEIEFELEKV